MMSNLRNNQSDVLAKSARAIAVGLTAVTLFVLIAMRASSNVNATEYAGLARYREADFQLTSVAESNRVVFFGDSITELWNLDQFFPHQPYVNRGIIGQTTSQMVLRFHQDVVQLKPRSVVILGGINDLGAGVPVGQ